MFWVYILKDQISGKYYIGQTNNVEARLTDHRRGKDHATKGGSWACIYQEPYNTRSEAIQRERYLKSLKSRRAIEKIIIAGWSSSSSQGP